MDKFFEFLGKMIVMAAVVGVYAYLKDYNKPKIPPFPTMKLTPMNTEPDLRKAMGIGEKSPYWAITPSTAPKYDWLNTQRELEKLRQESRKPTTQSKAE